VRVRRFGRDGDVFLVASYPVQRPAAFASLNPAELAVVEAVLDGQSQRAIALERGVAARTVANQLASAYRKLGVRGAAEIAVMLRRGTS
jgi:DNA-binding NarL/FixJ family response regulator